MFPWVIIKGPLAVAMGIFQLSMALTKGLVENVPRDCTLFRHSSQRLPLVATV